ncbi:MAG: LacI family DNA-binding transcriptional regulator [Lacisediminihabitans sp.]
MVLEPKKRRPTLAMVARVAETSIPTVSKVLRGGTDVSPATRDRVMEAVRAVGYSMRTTSVGGVGVHDSTPPALIDLVVNHVDGTWANGVLIGVEGVATTANVDVIITVARADGQWLPRLLRRPSQGAVMVLVDPSEAQFAALNAAQIPVVLVTPMSQPSASVPAVGVTNWDGGRAAAEHLLDLGHTRVGIVGGTRTHLYSRARIDGFRSAFEDAGISLPIKVAHADWDRGKAQSEARQMLSESERVTAIFACSDVMALGVYDAARELSLAIPTDLSVVGFDDVPEAEWASPSMTTIHQPIVEMGATAVRLLLQEIANRDTGSAHSAHPRLDLETRLIVRESTTAYTGHQ